MDKLLISTQDIGKKNKTRSSGVCFYDDGSMDLFHCPSLGIWEKRLNEIEG